MYYSSEYRAVPVQFTTNGLESNASSCSIINGILNNKTASGVYDNPDISSAGECRWN